LDDFSSHGMLWETIRREIGERPEAVGSDARAYLDRQIETYGVAEEGLDRTLFIEQLIRPVFAQAVARFLIRVGLPLRLFGEGWSRLDEFAPHAAGPIRSRLELANAVAASRVLIHCWPERHAHPIDAVGRPVVRAAGKAMQPLVSEIREAARLRGKLRENGVPVLNGEGLLRTVYGHRQGCAAGQSPGAAG
jgi:hypothetical protein